MRHFIQIAESRKCGAAMLLCMLLSVALPWAAQGAAAAHGLAEVDPLSAAHGKITVLVFVRSDCPISNRYAPTIQRLAAKYSSQVKFWLVYPDRAELPSTIRQHDAEYGYKLAVLRDPQRKLVQKSRVKTTPEAAVFDARGQLIYHGRIDDLYVDIGKHRAAPTAHELDDALQAAIAKKPVAVSATTAVGCYIADLP